jgi:hypothetical protein
MKFAIANGMRREAMPGLQGTCPVCDAGLRPKCGTIRVHHWAHTPGVVDHRWEPETEWHRNWKKPLPYRVPRGFPIECQEFVQRAESGERHIADVRTSHGRVLEFQHSSISDQERRAREEFRNPLQSTEWRELAPLNVRQSVWNVRQPWAVQTLARRTWVTRGRDHSPSAVRKAGARSPAVSSLS